MVEHHQLTVPPNHHRSRGPSSFPLPTRERAYLYCCLYGPSHRHTISAHVNQIHSGVTPVNDAANVKEKSISAKTAAGVLIPLLFICLCVAAWFKMQRAKGKEKGNCGAS